MRRSNRISLRALSWATVFAATALHGQQAQPVAGVLDLNGNWHLEGQQGPVKAGQKLSAGDKLSTAQYNYDNWITIVHYDDGSRTRIACENSSRNPCRDPYVLNASNPNTKSQVPVLIKAAFDLLVGKPPAILSHDSATIGRGKLVALREDVVNLSAAKGVSLKGRIPVLPAGVYNVEASNDDGNQTPITVQLSTEADGSWQSSVPISAPGLYTIKVKNPAGELRADLMILFVNAPEYETARQKFDAVKNQADTWQGVDAQTDEHTLLRAILLTMSRST